MRGPRHGNCGGRLAPPRCDGDRRRPCGAGLARRRARSGARRRSPDPPGVPWRDVRSRAGPIPMLRGGGTARACCGPCSVSFPGRWGRVNGPTIRIQAYRVPAGCGQHRGPATPRAGVAGPVGWCVFRWCPTLPLPGGGSTIGAGGLSFRVRYGSGRFPARCGRRDGGGVVVRGPWWPAPPRVGVGWVGSGLRSGRGVWFAARPGALGRWCGCVCVGGCVVRVGLLVPVG